MIEDEHYRYNLIKLYSELIEPQNETYKATSERLSTILNKGNIKLDNKMLSEVISKIRRKFNN